MVKVRCAAVRAATGKSKGKEGWCHLVLSRASLSQLRGNGLRTPDLGRENGAFDDCEGAQASPEVDIVVAHANPLRAMLCTMDEWLELLELLVQLWQQFTRLGERLLVVLVLGLERL